MGDTAEINPVLRKRIEHIVKHVRNSSDVEEGVRRAVADFVKPEAKKDPYADPSGVVHDPGQIEAHASTVTLCKDIADILVRHYPGWLWAIQPDDRGQMINIFCQNLHNQYGFAIRMVEIMNDPKRKLAIEAGAEILRRFNMPYRYDPGAVSEAPRDIAGNCIPDLTGIATKKQQHEQRIAKALADGSMTIVEGPDGKRYARMETK